jgi:hypothetical protein
MDLDFDIDFGSVKALPEVPDGEYLMTIVDWNLVEPQKEETKSKGMNLRVKFKFTDPEFEGHDISVIQPNDQIFFMFNNPFSIVPLLSAIKRTDKGDPSQLGKLSLEVLSDKSEWIGEQVIARLVRTEAANGKKYLNPVSDAYLPAPF